MRDESYLHGTTTRNMDTYMRKTANKLKHTQTCTWIYENVFMHKQADPRRNNATIIEFSFYYKYT